MNVEEYEHALDLRFAQEAVYWRADLVPSACDHSWRWLDGVQLIRDRLGQVTRYENVECTRCGTRAWKHGTMPAPTPRQKGRTDAR